MVVTSRVALTLWISVLQVRTPQSSRFISRGPAASSPRRSASSSSPSRVTPPTGCHGDQPAPPCRLWVWGREERVKTGRRTKEGWRAKVLPHLLLPSRVSLLFCPSPSKFRPLACALPALIVPGNSVTRVTRVVSSTNPKVTTKTTSAATAATPWTVPPMTATSSMAAATTVTRGDRDKGGGCHPGQGGREEGGGEEDPTMHHSSQDLTPTTTACHAPGPRPSLLKCSWGWGLPRSGGASARRPG